MPAFELRTDITKEETSRSLIVTAIGLLFAEGSAIAVHLLANAAGRICRDMCKAKGIENSRDVGLLRLTKPEYIKIVIQVLNKAYNYFKHAESDPEVDLEHFHPKLTFYNLYEACQDYGRAFGEMTPEMKIYCGWVLLVEPDLFKTDDPSLKKAMELFDQLHLKSDQEQIEEGRRIFAHCLSLQLAPLPFKNWPI